ncbi:MAG: hypothetical protein JNJ59_08390 [Deltaproteobacteria bacterium]|nr:hypothetical protein [Deltaproteobacteria bacterium]
MLKETLSQTDLIALPLFAFILFALTFLFVVVRVLMRGRRDAQYATLERLPLEDDVAQTAPLSLSQETTRHED